LTTVSANERGTSSRSYSQGGLVTIAYQVTPSGLTADTVRYRSVDVSWDAVTGADSYNVYVDGTQTVSTTSTSATVDGLDPETAYSITVTAIDGGAESGESDAVSPVTGGVAPESVTATAEGTQVDLAWTDTNPDEDGYEIHRSTASGVDTSGSSVATVGAGAESFTDDPPDGRTVFYRVVAVRNGERGVDSAEVSVSVLLPAPTGVTVDDVRDTEIDLSWTANTDDATGHRIDVREDDTGSWVATGDDIAGDVASATATGLLNGQLYGLRVVALAPDAESPDYDPDVAAGETYEFVKPLTVEDSPFDKPLENSGTVQPDDTQ